MMHPHQASRTQLRVSTRKRRIELPLVVVVSEQCMIVYSANINDEIAGLEKLRVSGADERSIFVGFE